jgi:hypothetical protein
LKGDDITDVVAYSNLDVSRAVDGQGQELDHYIGTTERQAVMFGITPHPVPLYGAQSRVQGVPGQSAVDVSIVVNNPGERPEKIATLAGSLRLMQGKARRITVPLELAEAGPVDSPELEKAGLQATVRDLREPARGRNGMGLVTIAAVLDAEAPQPDGLLADGALPAPYTVAGATLLNPDRPDSIRSYVDGMKGTVVVTATGDIGPETVLSVDLVEDVQHVSVDFAVADIDVPAPKPAKPRKAPTEPQLRGGGVVQAGGEPRVLTRIDIPTDAAGRATALKSVQIDRAVDGQGFELTFDPQATGLPDWDAVVPVLAGQGAIERSWKDKCLTANLRLNAADPAAVETVTVQGKLIVLAATDTRAVEIGDLAEQVDEPIENDALNDAHVGVEILGFNRPGGADRVAVTVRFWGKLENLVAVELVSDEEPMRALATPLRQRRPGDDLRVIFTSGYADDLRLRLTLATGLEEVEVPFAIEDARLPVRTYRPKRPEPDPEPADQELP